MAPTNVLQEEQNHQPHISPGRHIDYVITILSFVFFATGLSIAIAHPKLGMVQAWAVFTASFCFSMTGTVITYYFLSSNAQIEETWIKIGGAGAGFLCLFWVLVSQLHAMLPAPESQPALALPAEIEKDIQAIVTNYENIDQFHNATIKNIARNSIRGVKRTFGELASGTYTIEASDLPIYLMPLIDNAKKTYWATQYVLPTTFWDQYWSKTYFDKNVTAVTERKIDLLRIFILDTSETKPQKEVLDALINKHAAAGLKVLILDRDEYEKRYGSEDLVDMLLIDDELSGILLLEKGGKFSKVQFSVDQQTINERKQRLLRLISFSSDYKTWVKKYHKEWLQ